MTKKQSAGGSGGDGASKRKKTPAKKPVARKGEGKAEEKSGGKADKKSGGKAETKAEKKPGGKAQGKAETKPEPKAERKPSRRGKAQDAQQRLPVDVVAEAPVERAPADEGEREVSARGRAYVEPDTEVEPGSDDADEAFEADDADDVEDAEILAETPADSTQETAPVPAAADDDAEGAPEAAPLTEEERELRELYGDVGGPARAHSEFADRQTADEDRPMVPEINAREERKQRWEERRDRRRQRREERGRHRQDRQDRPPQRDGQAARPGEARPGEARSGEGRPGEGRSGEGRSGEGRSGEGRSGEAREARPPREGQPPRPAMPAGAPEMRSATATAPAATASHDHDALARVGTPLGEVAATVFAQLRNGQPLPVRQLAAMMRKRNLVEVDPEQLAPQLKAELLGDERSYRTLGLRPRIVYRGRDLFAPGPVSMSATADAEAGFAAALSRLAGATHRALAQRLVKASPAGFERLIHAYLVAAGYREIAWVKRVNGISYASAVAPGLDRPVLLSARAGDQPIDRRGIGELRVGVEAKNLVAGILFSARELSEEAERELERAGRSIAVICGDHLVATLITAGVGVVSASAPLHYVDDQLLDELLAG